MRRREATPPALAEDEGEEDDASDHVRHVDPGHHVEQRAERRRPSRPKPSCE